MGSRSKREPICCQSKGLEACKARLELIDVPDDCGEVHVIITLRKHAADGPSVRGVESTVHWFASRDVDAAGAFVIEVVVERRSAQFDTCFNIESGHFKRELGAVELNYASTLRKIQCGSLDGS